MTEKNLAEFLFTEQGIKIEASRRDAFEAFVEEPATQAALEGVRIYQKQIMEKWQIHERIIEVERQQAALPNGNEGKPYEAHFDLARWGWTDLQETALEGLEATGLSLDAESGMISGIPQQGGDVQLTFRYRVPGEAPDAPLHQRPLLLIINPDPRNLWKEIVSNADDPHWKPDTAELVLAVGERTLVAASKRGRSHANTGGFREDHFACTHSEESGWSLVAVSDGAGSARLSRHGSELACKAVTGWFHESFCSEAAASFEQDLDAMDGGGEEVQKRMSAFIYTTLQAGAWKAHKELEAFAVGAGVPIRDLHCTLVYTLFKKTNAGYVFLSFGVGDCPIALLSRNAESVTLLNTLDVGAFSGGTRFITMPEIFAADNFPSRINYKLVDDFGYLVLMSDGIYDPKFGVEANLDRIGQWRAFLDDLGGANEGGEKVELVPGNTEAGVELLRWMDFWSPGNHDDRTLVLVF